MTESKKPESAELLLGSYSHLFELVSHQRLRVKRMKPNEPSRECEEIELLQRVNALEKKKKALLVIIERGIRAEHWGGVVIAAMRLVYTRTPVPDTESDYVPRRLMRELIDALRATAGGFRGVSS